MAVMADDLAASLADAIVTAAVRAAGNHSDWPKATAAAYLAADLRRIMETTDLPEWYAGYEAGCREQSAAQCDRPGCRNAEHHDLSGGDYSAPDYTPDERHRHTIGGQVWEHSHEGGHEAHSAVSHDLSGAALIGTPEPRSGDVLERSTCRHCSVPVVLLHVSGGSGIWNHERMNRRYAPCAPEGYRLAAGLGNDKRERYVAAGGTWAEPITEEAPTERHAFGWETGSAYGPRGIVGRPESSATGNIILRVGNENAGAQGWTQVAHVVLTRSEARELAQAIQAEMDDR